MSSRKAFVVGWPVAHSRSPLIHRFWLKRHGIDGDYVAEAVPPDSIEAFLGGFGEQGYVGGNVTLPHKEAAFRACRESDAVARRLGAANTLWLEDGSAPRRQHRRLWLRRQPRRTRAGLAARLHSARDRRRRRRARRAARADRGRTSRRSSC